MNKITLKEFAIDLFNKLKGITSFTKYKIDEKTYTILAVLFLLAILPLPYEYYNTLRTLVCVGLGYFLYLGLGKENNVYKYGLIGLIILYNPIIPIHLSKPIWTIINIATLYFIFHFKFKNRTQEE